MGLLVPVLGLWFGWLKVRDEQRFTLIEAGLKDARGELVISHGQIDVLEKELKQLEHVYRAAADAWGKERSLLLQELNALRSTVARLEIGITAASITINDQDKIVDCNPTASDMLGWGKEELLGKSVRVLVPFRFREAHATALAAVLAGTHPLRTDGLDTFALSRTGQEIPVTITLSTWNDEGKRYFGAELRRRSV